ncbi:insulin-like growth factor-binding protein complex acid labile subunit [Adelges cooleyi]|uniref:insulin-like growth factor-binding protein complex acid labile subunit n=1 Tax=Adelges cooleyi TaxID=133065 RepID=UPI00217F9217|nr:insulin-like growth factor-binding protein complex acid labile subunit [Adelges cooleyi]
MRRTSTTMMFSRGAATAVWLIIVMTAVVVIQGHCPSNCSCDDDTLVVYCKDDNLDVIPITLNPSIQRLVLMHNRIKIVDASFQFYGALQYVDISHNHLVNIPNKGFEAQEKLIELHLNHNKISSINNKTFIGLVSLTILNLRGNYLEDLPDRLFAALPKLEELDLGENRISRIDPAAFQGLSRLRVLYLDDNQLRAVPTPSFKFLGNLAEMRIGLNAFTTLDNDCFTGLSRLSVLDLTGAALINISTDAFKSLTALRRLVLTDNRLSAIPTRQLSELNRLEELSIGQNDFTTLEPNAFKGLSNLRTLDISGAAQLSIIKKGVFTENLNLETINFSSNKQLSTVESGALIGLPNLKNLIMRNNAFTSFSESMVTWQELQQIDLTENPVVCECSVLWLKELLVRRNTSLMVCSGPVPLKGKSLNSLSSEDLSCAKFYTKQQAIVGAVFGCTVAFIALMMLLAYRFRKRLHHSLKKTFWSKETVVNRKDLEYQKTFSDEEYIVRNSTAQHGQHRPYASGVSGTVDRRQHHHLHHGQQPPNQHIYQTPHQLHGGQTLQPYAHHHHHQQQNLYHHQLQQQQQQQFYHQQNTLPHRNDNTIPVTEL